MINNTDLNNDVINQTKTKEIIKYVKDVFKTYFKMKNFKVQDRIMSENFIFQFEYYGHGFHCSCIDIKTRDTICLMRYYNYPDIDEDFNIVTWTPYSDWILGFAEKLIYTLDTTLLNIIENKNNGYEELLADSKNALFAMSNNKIDSKDWPDKIKQIEQENLIKEFKPSFLCYERKSKKEIKEDIIRLLSK